MIASIMTKMFCKSNTCDSCICDYLVFPLEDGTGSVGEEI
jgi:hypothetical protein